MSVQNVHFSDWNGTGRNVQITDVQMIESRTRKKHVLSTRYEEKS